MDTGIINLGEVFCTHNSTSLPQPSTMRDFVNYANGLLDFAMEHGIDKDGIGDVVSRSCSTWTPQQRTDLLELASAFGELIEDTLGHAVSSLRGGRDMARDCSSAFALAAGKLS